MVVADYPSATSSYAVGHASWRCQHAYPGAAIVHPVICDIDPGMNHSCADSLNADVVMERMPDMGGQPEQISSRERSGNPESSSDPVICDGVQAQLKP